MGGICQGDKSGYENNYYDFGGVGDRKYLDYGGDQLVGNNCIGEYFCWIVFYYVFGNVDKGLMGWFIKNRYIIEGLCGYCGIDEIVCQYY